MNFKILYHPSVKKDLKVISKKDRARIQRAIENKLISDPLLYSHPLRGSLKPSFKFRVGKYRIIFDLLDDEIHVLVISHRRAVYEEAQRRK